jgi:hypothetical protein
MHDHEGHDLQIVVDANLADNIPVESFVQDSGAISASDEFFWRLFRAWHASRR